jgi:hypothetical protein
MADTPVDTMLVEASDDDRDGDELLKVQLTAVGGSLPLGYRLVRSFAAPSLPMSSELVKRRTRYARRRKENQSRQADT